MRLALAICGSLAALPAAGEPSFLQPINCVLGQDCYIQNYFDHDDSTGIRDSACDNLTYDGHKGVDFALIGDKAELHDQKSRSQVLAAADGVVLGARNGMPDKIVGTDRETEVAGKECGNGVVIDHGDGWHSQYCHLKQGSVLVQQGQQVAAGDVLGDVGMSGFTAFRHLHFTVRKDGQRVDPFSADGAPVCGTPSRQLWQTPLPHVPAGWIEIGISSKIPAYQDVVAWPNPAPDWTTSQPDALVLWAFGFGIDEGDIVQLTIEGPDRTIVDQTIEIDRTQSRFFRATGLKRPPTGWSAGDYSGTAILMQNDEILATKTVSFTVD